MKKAGTLRDRRFAHELALRGRPAGGQQGACPGGAAALVERRAADVSGNPGGESRAGGVAGGHRRGDPATAGAVSAAPGALPCRGPATRRGRASDSAVPIGTVESRLSRAREQLRAPSRPRGLARRPRQWGRSCNRRNPDSSSRPSSRPSQGGDGIRPARPGCRRC